MIDARQAKTIAEKEFPELIVSSCLDMNESFAFTFVDENYDPVPGIPVVTVNKENENVDYITIPPIENLALLDEAKEVKL